MKYPFKIGQWVQSHFRSTWKGQIVEGPDKINCYIVKVLIDQHNNPLRKPKLHRLNGRWLRKINPPS